MNATFFFSSTQQVPWPLRHDCWKFYKLCNIDADYRFVDSRCYQHAAQTLFTGPCGKTWVILIKFNILWSSMDKRKNELPRIAAPTTFSTKIASVSLVR